MDLGASRSPVDLLSLEIMPSAFSGREHFYWLQKGIGYTWLDPSIDDDGRPNPTRASRPVDREMIQCS